MKNNNVYCPMYGDAEYKNINGKPVCKICGRVVTEEEIVNDIKIRFEEFKNNVTYHCCTCKKEYREEDFEYKNGVKCEFGGYIVSPSGIVSMKIDDDMIKVIIRHMVVESYSR